MLLENGALYFDARSLYARAYGPKGRRLALADDSRRGRVPAMWTDFLAAAETGRPPALSLEDIFADFAYLDAAYRSKASGRPEVPKRPPALA